MKTKTKKLTIVWALLLILSLVLAGCGSKDAGSAAGGGSDAGASASAGASSDSAAEDTYKIAYISKMLTNPWFVAEDNGLRDKAAELGVEYFSIDANLDDEACDAAIDNAIAQDIDALAITITNQGNGPALAQKCADAGIALITLDDNIVDQDGKDVPHVGLPTKDVGVLGGEKLAEYANARDFFAEGNVVGILQIDAPDITVLRPRIDGYEEALRANTPATDENFIYVETSECMLEDSLVAAHAAVQAHPEVTHWIVGAVNDDSAIAAVKTFEEAGIDEDHYLACGLGGYSMSVDEWEKGNDSYMAIILNPYGEGQAAMEHLYNFLKSGTPLPPLTLINGTVATLDNWETLVDPNNL
ncbi:L-arabinose-binding periplasmic protein [Clostridia bacterium]|nr:L-arabinose-binding periplasmic protein [Clostridia bacterium]